MPAMLEIRQLACQRGDRLLFRRLDFSAAPGELVRVAGANGMGKTSLLRLVAGLTEPAAGEVRWRGERIAAAREAFHAALFYLGHGAAFNELLSPLENLRFAAAAAGLDADAAACVAALDEIGLGRQRDLPCRVLSQGQRRRVALARLALSAARPLWLLDEPFTALDAKAVAALAGRIDAHCAAGGTVLLTSHQDVAFTTPPRVLDVEAFVR